MDIAGDEITGGVQEGLRLRCAHVRFRARG